MSEEIIHYGVKGMKWGVIRDRKGSDDYRTSSDLIFSEVDQAECADKLHKNVAEDLPRASPRKGLTRNQKIAIGAGVVAVTLAAYGAYRYSQNGPGLLVPPSMSQSKTDNSDMLKSIFGGEFAPREHVKYLDNLTYRDGTSHYFQGFKEGKAFDRPAFTIPKGTAFQRMSNNVEDAKGYAKGAYATFLPNDRNIYQSHPEFASKKFVLNFTSDSDVKVPDLQTVLEHVKPLMPKGMRSTPEEVLREYKNLSGGSWQSKDGAKLIKSLRKAGYSALVDEMDAGHLGDLPLVFFGKVDAFASSQQTADKRKVAESLVQKISERYS